MLTKYSIKRMNSRKSTISTNEKALFQISLDQQVMHHQINFDAADMS